MRELSKFEIESVSGGDIWDDIGSGVGKIFDSIAKTISDIGDALQNLANGLGNLGAGIVAGSLEISVCTGDKATQTPNTSCGNAPAPDHIITITKTPAPPAPAPVPAPSGN